ncbi:hypothetical protein [Pseudoduganella aquatica]|uniref:Uncharacterized protein n=1 Tax=Pseudoduganella aquatica TaxID=2660641 RepID=A0A7X4KR69_9BURK|nr:hypothetical protein [Pseudoduganella aquatica]MYN11081.1 hypothetical protein [Pseudoduganella aquatica]
MKTLTTIALFSLLGLSFGASAAGHRSASMQVSFVITESCNIQSGKDAAKPVAATVSCQHESPYQLQRNDAAVQTSAQAAAKSNAIVNKTEGAQEWTVYF